MKVINHITLFFSIAVLLYVITNQITCEVKNNKNAKIRHANYSLAYKAGYTAGAMAATYKTDLVWQFKKDSTEFETIFKDNN